MVETITSCAGRIGTRVIALGAVLAVAACAAPPAAPTATLKPALADHRILAVRPVSAAGSGSVSGVLATIGVGPIPRQIGQELIIQNAHGRVLSVVRTGGSVETTPLE